MKELRDYLKLFRNYLPLIGGVVLLCILGMLTWQLGKKVTYQATATIYLSKNSEAKNNQYYTYEGYYALVSAKESTDVLVGVLKSPDLQRIAYGDRDDLEVVDTQVKKTNQQLIEVKVSATGEEASKKAVTALLQAGATKAKLTSDHGFEASFVNPEIMVVRVEPNLALSLGIAVLAGVIVSLLVIVTREYFLA